MDYATRLSKMLYWRSAQGLKFCGRQCYFSYSVKVVKPIEKAQARLAEMRAAGLSPGHGGEAAKKRGAALATNNRLRITERGVTRRIEERSP